ncbi:39S ribosomal protein L30, mitochondrial-like isoform X1 [Anneissia japonica]|uniref:39S ribosomal protein L30, mitochondrial-like isoform X1 n=1 Tax=Anneissia japonica TaxID=1529436 RepID=UPI0014254D69|nr:39S ribosomal protein L30, mitochondrial-like isoform X1 [Anneissia japonica]
MAASVLKNVILRPQNWIVKSNPFYALTRPFCSAHRPGEMTSSDEERPHMLHAVWRIRGLNRRPYWERKLCEKLGLHYGLGFNFFQDKTQLHSRFQAVVHKNTPQVNILLSKVRHLIRIKPVILRDGVPEDSDFENSLLKWNGEFIIRKKVEPTNHNTQPSLPSGTDSTTATVNSR